LEGINMTEKRKVSDVLSEVDIKNLGNKICIVAGVGAGKNYWVINDLVQKGNVLLITSRKAVADETLADDNAFTSHAKSSYDIKQAVVFTNSLLDKLLHNSQSPHGLFSDKCHFDYIVIDEAHCLVTDSTFSNSLFHLWNFIEDVSKDSTVILMSATVNAIEAKLREGWEILDLTDKCIDVKPKKVTIISKKQAIRMLKTTTQSSKALYMCASAKDMINNLWKTLKENGINTGKVAGIMSDSRKKDLMANLPDEVRKTDRCYNSIVNQGVLPKEIEILLTTSRLREGINLKDKKIKKVFIESHHSIDLSQFIGRVRHGVENVYIIDDAKQNRTDKDAMLSANYCSIVELDSANKYLDRIVDKLRLNNWGDGYQNYYRNRYIKQYIDFMN